MTTTAEARGQRCGHRTPEQPDDVTVPWSHYRVEVIGESREVYIVEAVSREDAMDRWHEGDRVVTEVSSAEPTSAEVDS